MRPDDVAVGQTYRVHILERGDVARHLTGDPQRGDADLALLAWLISGTEDFDLTVTVTGQTLGGEPAVTGVRVAETCEISTPLTPEAAERLGLSSSVEYLVKGVLIDVATGHTVSRPTDQTVTIPARWLAPLGEQSAGWR
ncbi:MAG TPA: hypothetical protein VHW44_10985 [Pseudonocardiaceae bacterium]|jgi:hypothetical protein|nr:hypothetical protein [Pseudonocardiaceae bacterium]